MSSSSFPFFRHKSLTIAQAFSFRKDFLDSGFSSFSDDVFERFPGKMNIGLYWRQFGVRKTNFDPKVIRDWAAFNNLMLPLCYWRRECIINVIKFISIFSTQKPYYSPGFFVQERFFGLRFFFIFRRRFWALSRKNKYWSILESIWSKENNLDAKIIKPPPSYPPYKCHQVHFTFFETPGWWFPLSFPMIPLLPVNILSLVDGSPWVIWW